MDSDAFIKKAKELVENYTVAHLDKSADGTYPANFAYVVWSTKVLKNNKALLSTPFSDGMYYEVTYDGNRKKIYFDAYKKWENIEYDAYE